MQCVISIQDRSVLCIHIRYYLYQKCHKYLVCLVDFVDVLCFLCIYIETVDAIRQMTYIFCTNHMYAGFSCIGPVCTHVLL